MVGSGKNLFRIPDPGGKRYRIPDPQHYFLNDPLQSIPIANVNKKKNPTKLLCIMFVRGDTIFDNALIFKFWLYIPRWLQL